jgi:hypothetical protein
MKGRLLALLLGVISIAASSAESARAEAPNYSGIYKAALNMKSDSCLNVLPESLKRKFIVTHGPGGISAVEIVDNAPVPFEAQLLPKGFRVTNAQIYPDPTRGDCTYTDLLNFKKITANKSVLASYTYSERCVSEAAVTWHCKTTYSGSAKRRPAP